MQPQSVLNYSAHLSTVNSHVIFQINCFRERRRALITFVVFLSRVQLFMRPQTRIARELSSTNVARERLVIPETEETFLAFAV